MKNEKKSLKWGVFVKLMLFRMHMIKNMGYELETNINLRRNTINKWGITKK